MQGVLIAHKVKPHRRLPNRLLVVALLVLSVILGCRKRTEPPPRRPSIPREAVWAGGADGADGGSWILCTPLQDGSADECTIYHEYTGEVLASGLFVAIDTGRAVPRGELIYDSFDGSRIYLKDHQTLRLVKKPTVK